MNPIKSAVVALAASILASGAFAAEPAPVPQLVGAWAVDTSRLPMAPEARPRSVRITFATAGPGQLKAKVEVIDPTGARLEAEGITPLDGSPTQVASNFEADVSATYMPRPEVLIMQLAKGGSPASTRIYSLDPGGNTMIETVAFFTREGLPVLRRNYFSRVH